MNKIIVIGCPGSGKSTFARKLRDIIGLPLFYLDMIWHKVDKTSVTDEEFDDKLLSIMKQDEWIIDGNYRRTIEWRLEYCDTVFFLDYPTEVCIDGARNRVGKYREDMPWFEEELDDEFIKRIEEFNEEQRPNIYSLLNKYRYKCKIHIFKNRDEADNYLNRM